MSPSPDKIKAVLGTAPSIRLITMANDPASKSQPSPPPPTDPATPGFGWNYYAERLNGRFAMLGIIAILLIEILTGNDLITWLGFR
jgi:hypothetical protein